MLKIAEYNKITGKKIEEILEKEYKENIFGHYEYDLATAKNTIKKILDLLKEIK